MLLLLLLRKSLVITEEQVPDDIHLMGRVSEAAATGADYRCNNCCQLLRLAVMVVVVVSGFPLICLLLASVAFAFEHHQRHR